MDKNEAIQQIIELMRTNGVTMADLMLSVSSSQKIDQVHIMGGRWIEDFTPQEWAARGEQAAYPSDAYEMEFDTPLGVGPDGSVWAWIGSGLEILPDHT